MGGRKVEERKEEKKKRKMKIKKCGRGRKVQRERAKQIDVLTEWKREIGNNKLKK
jgi:hypothetical protein